MGAGRLETLARELFVDNIRFVRGKYVNPFNMDEIAADILSSDVREKAKQKELYESLIHVADAIKRDRGISRATYDANMYAINIIARKITGLTCSSNPNPDFLENEEREGKKATPEQAARFKDGEYGYSINGKPVNIFDEEFNPIDFEGTLFQTDYDIEGNLKVYRILHQSHRNELQVATVNLDGLIKNIGSFIAQYTDEIPKTEFGLTLDAETYMRKVDEFNREFGECIRIGVSGKGSKTEFDAVFKENPKDLATVLAIAAACEGEFVFPFKGPGTWIVRVKSPEYRSISLNPLRDSFESRTNESFNSGRDKDSKTFILFNKDRELSVQLMGFYARHKIN